MKIDTLVVAGGKGVRNAEIIAPYQKWVNKHFDSIPGVVSVCTGIFMVADHPYLYGKDVVTHWAFVKKLQNDFPQLKSRS